MNDVPFAIFGVTGLIIVLQVLYIGGFHVITIPFLIICIISLFLTFYKPRNK